MNQIYYLAIMGHKIWISCAKESMVLYRQSSRLSRINKANMNRIIWDRRNNILNYYSTDLRGSCSLRVISRLLLKMSIREINVSCLKFNRISDMKSIII